MYDIQQIQQQLELGKLAGHIYLQDNILVLQAPYQDDGSALNVFAQHEHSSEQIGLQFGIQVFQDHIDYLMGITFSNQDRSYEISAGNLKAEQKAFNLIYAFYNFPKKFHLVRIPLNASRTELELSLQQLIAEHPELAFVETTLKTNPQGEQYAWIKTFISQHTLAMKVRIQMQLNALSRP